MAVYRKIDLETAVKFGVNGSFILNLLREEKKLTLSEIHNRLYFIDLADIKKTLDSLEDEQILYKINLLQAPQITP